MSATYNAPLIQFSSWMGGDRDGNPRVTPEVTRDVCLLARMMAANLYYSQIEDLMFELSMWRCNEELRVRADVLHRSSRRDAKHYIGENQIFKLGHVIESAKVVVAGVSWQFTEGNVQLALLEGNQWILF